MTETGSLVTTAPTTHCCVRGDFLTTSKRPAIGGNLIGVFVSVADVGGAMALSRPEFSGVEFVFPGKRRREVRDRFERCASKELTTGAYSPEHGGPLKEATN